MACTTYMYESGDEKLFLLPSGNPPRLDNRATSWFNDRESCAKGNTCLDFEHQMGNLQNNPGPTPCTAGGFCADVIPRNFKMLTNANQDPTQLSTQCNALNSQGVTLANGIQVKYPTQCFAPILNDKGVSSCGLYPGREAGDVQLPIPCNDSLTERHGPVQGDRRNYYPIWPDKGGYPKTDFVNCQDDKTNGACRPYTFQTKIDPAYAAEYSGKLNVFGYWGATNMWDFPDLTQIHPAYNQVCISFFHIAKHNGKLALKCNMQRWGHESIWDATPDWSVFPDGYRRFSSSRRDCDNPNDGNCITRDWDCCRWVHNGGNPEGDDFGFTKLIAMIQQWKSNAPAGTVRTVLASLGGGAGANVTDAKNVPATGAFTEPDVVKKDNFVQTVLDFLITWGFDGIDNDYEALGGNTCPIGDPGSVVRKNWTDLYSGLKACNPGIILTAAPFNNGHMWEFVKSGFFDEIRPQLYNPGGYQIEKSKPAGATYPGGNDTWVQLLKSLARQAGLGPTLPGVLLEASCRSGSGGLKKQCWDMGRLANTIIYLNKQGEFGNPGKMMSVGVWDITQGQRLTDDSFAAAMNVIITNGNTQTPTQENLECYFNKIFEDPCSGKNKCWADCGAKSGAGDGIGGEELVNNHCDHWISLNGYCGQGEAYEDQGIQCGTRCADCRSGDHNDGGIQGKPCEQLGAYCSTYGYCGTGSDYSKETGVLCGKPQGLTFDCTDNTCVENADGTGKYTGDDNWSALEKCNNECDPCRWRRRAWCNNHGQPTQDGANCICTCEDGWTGDRCQTRVSPQGQCTAEQCKQEECGRVHPFLCTEGPAKNGCGLEDGWAGVSCSNYCDTRTCGGGGDLPQCIPGQFCPPERKGGPLIPCPASGQCPYANPAQPLFLSNINI